MESFLIIYYGAPFRPKKSENNQQYLIYVLLGAQTEKKYYKYGVQKKQAKDIFAQ